MTKGATSKASVSIRLRVAGRFSMLAALWMTALVPLSCAKVGDPLPPLYRQLPPVNNLRIVQTGATSVSLLFGPPAPETGELEILRSCGAPLEPDSKPYARVLREEFQSVPGSKMLRADDPAPISGRPCQYAVRFRAPGFEPSVSSNRVSTSPTAPPPVPVDLTVDVREHTIEVKWALPKSTEASGLSFLVNGRHVTNAPNYVDRDFAFGEPRSYSVQTIAHLADPTVLSDSSEAVQVVPEDTFPPKAPANLRAVRIGTEVQLLWDAGVEPDIAGYAVYRRSGSDPFVKIADLTSVNRFLDKAPPVGQVSYYEVTALDKRANESAHSNTVQFTNK